MAGRSWISAESNTACVQFARTAVETHENRRQRGVDASRTIEARRRHERVYFAKSLGGPHGSRTVWSFHPVFICAIAAQMSDQGASERTATLCALDPLQSPAEYHSSGEYLTLRRTLCQNFGSAVIPIEFKVLLGMDAPLRLMIYVPRSESLKLIWRPLQKFPTLHTTPQTTYSQNSLIYCGRT